MTKVSLLSALALTALSSTAHAAWDALPLAERLFPATAWEQRFATQPDVLATQDIEDAIDRCDDIVGPKGYCVVQITDSALRKPVYINRSKTKIIGVDGMKPLRAKKYENTLTVVGNTHHVVIEGLELKGHFTGWGDVYGIVVIGENINGVVIRDNHIHDYKSNDNAHAIAVYGEGRTARLGIRNVLIESNNVHDMKTGSSESIVVNGNIRRWAIVDNSVRNVNNIAIDAIGGEGTSPTRELPSGRVVPGSQDRARFGFILNNRVENMSTVGNPAYGGKRSWAAGIYVDGGSRIKIEGNSVVNTPWAYEIGAENCLITSHIIVSNNTSSGSYYGDLLLGGYAETGFRQDESINCDPGNSEDVSEGHGYVARIRVQGNQFESTATHIENILPQFRLRGAVILQEGIEAVNTHRNGGAPGDENAILTQEP